MRKARYFDRGVLPDWPWSHHILNWAEWHRRHAADPQWEQHVIDRNGNPNDPSAGPATHRYDRWHSWRQGDPRWHVLVLDNTGAPLEDVLTRLAEWVQEARSAPSPPALGTRWAGPT